MRASNSTFGQWKRLWSVLGVLGVLPSLMACGADAKPTDGGIPDASPTLDACMDGNTTPMESGLPDVGAPDALPADAGPLDAGPLDAGPRCELSAPRFVRSTLIPPDVRLPDTATTANIRSADLRGDGRPQLLVSDADRGRVVWLEGCNETGCERTTFIPGLAQPVRTQVVDLEGDGDRDILVADIGSIVPTEALVGRVVLLANDGSYNFDLQIILEDVGRVACAEAADLDADGDLDIVVCVFGHAAGELLWLEQTEVATFVPHTVESLGGSIHAFPVDVDADGDLDLVSVFSQNDESVRLFRNSGTGDFVGEVLWTSADTSYGFSGMEPADLDRDGDIDLLITNGDYYDFDFGAPAELTVKHGLAWLENDGEGGFAYHDIIRLLAAYSVRAGDFDGDCDTDLVLSSYILPDTLPEPFASSPALSWLENDGHQVFSVHEIADSPPGLASVEVLDLDEDGRLDIVTGSLASLVPGGAPPYPAVLFRNTRVPP